MRHRLPRPQLLGDDYEAARAAVRRVWSEEERLVRMRPSGRPSRWEPPTVRLVDGRAMDAVRTMQSALDPFADPE